MNADVKDIVLGLQGGSVSSDMFFENRKAAFEAARDFILGNQFRI